ncbi:MAG: DUF3108 domain-containing protein, partial [Rhodomicrobium sp.]|nr:DUF3108 domain-containing protein [Rhodomicrobium sp.]
MAKTPLLPGALGRPAAAILIPVLLLLSFATTRAYADGEGAPQASPAAESTAPAGGKKPEEAAKAPLAEAADAAQAAPKETKAAEKPLDAKPADAAAADDKKPSEPKEAKAGANPADADSSAPKPAGAKEAKADPKPKDITPRPENTNPVRSSIVNAVYRISWLGAHIGDFRIHSSITNRQYSLQANADLSVFFGTVSWKGVTSSHGLMTANGPVPKDYTFRYSTNDRREAIELRFQQRMVQDIIINPPARPGGRNVPITAAHLQNVVDPLSAIVLLSAVAVRGDEDERLVREAIGAFRESQTRP